MKCKIYYTSSRSVAEAIADTIGQTIGVTPERLNPAYMPDGVDLMFLGCDGPHTDEVVIDFIRTLKPSRVKCAALFNTNSKAVYRAIERMREALQEKGISVQDRSFVAVSRPFQKEPEGLDRASVAEFARHAVQAARDRERR